MLKFSICRPLRRFDSRKAFRNVSHRFLSCRSEMGGTIHCWTITSPRSKSCHKLSRQFKGIRRQRPPGGKRPLVKSDPFDQECQHQFPV